MRLILIVITLLLSVITFSQQKRPAIVTIYPTQDSIPVNVLRFYIRFSQPMQETGILKHVTLTNDQGKDLTGVFFDNDNELWNKDRTEVTLIVDPGRVKTGLLAHNLLGWAFDEGKKYSLTVDSLILDFQDRTLISSITKEIIATPPQNVAPDVHNWHVQVPSNESFEALLIDFGISLDHISASTLIRVKNEKGLILQGAVSLHNHEKRWYFKPSEKWKAGSYIIEVGSDLEDIAANSLRGAFNHPTRSLELSPDIQRLYFRIK